MLREREGRERAEREREGAGEEIFPSMLSHFRVLHFHGSSFKHIINSASSSILSLSLTPSLSNSPISPSLFFNCFLHCEQQIDDHSKKMFKSECPHATDTGADRTTSFCPSSSTSRLQFSQTMNQRLKEAASTGDIASLYSIIQEDNYILDRIDEVPFVETPLHVSALEGHFYFSFEMMRLKPALAEKLNPEGYSPLYLAILYEQIETVLRLIKANPYLKNV